MALYIRLTIHMMAIHGRVHVRLTWGLLNNDNFVPVLPQVDTLELNEERIREYSKRRVQSCPEASQREGHSHLGRTKRARGYVSTANGRPACAKPLRRRQGTPLAAFFNTPILRMNNINPLDEDEHRTISGQMIITVPKPPATPTRTLMARAYVP
jgi:hypothetical protein